MDSKLMVLEDADTLNLNTKIWRDTSSQTFGLCQCLLPHNHFKYTVKKKRHLFLMAETALTECFHQFYSSWWILYKACWSNWACCMQGAHVQRYMGDLLHCCISAFHVPKAARSAQVQLTDVYWWTLLLHAQVRGKQSHLLLACKGMFHLTAHHFRLAIKKPMIFSRN